MFCKQCGVETITYHFCSSWCRCEYYGENFEERDAELIGLIEPEEDDGNDD